MRRIFRFVGLGAILIIIGVQFAQPDRTNPPPNPAASFEAVGKPDPAAAAVLKRACYDCHSNVTSWPWYSRIAPISWLVVSDVREGRARLNFSEWNLLSQEAAAKRLMGACDEAKAGEMPLWQYRLMHEAARLSEQDADAICNAAARAAVIQSSR